MADLASTRIFGKLTVMHDVIVKANQTMDAGTNTVLTLLCNDGGASEVRLHGGSQGTGRLYVGQSDSHGGGIGYNGDGTPETTGAGSDYITLWRRDDGDDEWTAKNKYNSNNWEFRGDVTSSASDGRLKENVEEIGEALEKLSHIRGVSYDWSDDCEALGFTPTQKHEHGVIAQEVQRVIPDAVAPAPFNSDYLTVKYDRLVPLLIQGLKEETAKREALEERLAKLEALVEG